MLLLKISVFFLCNSFGADRSKVFQYGQLKTRLNKIFVLCQKKKLSKNVEIKLQRKRLPLQVQVTSNVQNRKALVFRWLLSQKYYQ